MWHDLTLTGVDKKPNYVCAQTVRVGNVGRHWWSGHFEVAIGCLTACCVDLHLPCTVQGCQVIGKGKFHMCLLWTDRCHQSWHDLVLRWIVSRVTFNTITPSLIAWCDCIVIQYVRMLLFATGCVRDCNAAIYSDICFSDPSRYTWWFLRWYQTVHFAWMEPAHNF